MKDELQLYGGKSLSSGFGEKNYTKDMRPLGFVGQKQVYEGVS